MCFISVIQTVESVDHSVWTVISLDHSYVWLPERTAHTNSRWVGASSQNGQLVGRGSQNGQPLCPPTQSGFVSSQKGQLAGPGSQNGQPLCSQTQGEQPELPEQTARGAGLPERTAAMPPNAELALRAPRTDSLRGRTPRTNSPYVPRPGVSGESSQNGQLVGGGEGLPERTAPMPGTGVAPRLQRQTWA